jgi:hypothetical protein
LGGCLAGVEDFLADMVGWMMWQGNKDDVARNFGMVSKKCV